MDTWVIERGDRGALPEIHDQLRRSRVPTTTTTVPTRRRSVATVHTVLTSEAWSGGGGDDAGIDGLHEHVRTLMGRIVWRGVLLRRAIDFGLADDGWVARW